MQRRSFLQNLGANAKAKLQSPLPPPAGIEKYTGQWTNTQAVHLLRRTMFGPTLNQIKEATNVGLSATVEKLLEVLSPLAPPLNYDYDFDPNVPKGETWVGTPNYSQNAYRARSLRAWTMAQYVKGEMNIREKMTLFWHNHFVVADINDPRFLYRYMDLLRTKGLGNFRDLTKEMTIEPVMLRYLNGNQNTKTAPNENYARELLELFTIGKGPQVGPGDYTNYTEDDVIAIARVLTGWRDAGYNNVNTADISSYFTLNRHDTGSKTLSPRFDNVVINNAGENEYENLIDIIFQKREVAKFFCRNIYQWFLYYKIDDTIEQNVIEPLAQIMIDNDYEIMPVLKVFFESAHFNDDALTGCMIKNPIDFIATIFHQFGINDPIDLETKYKHWLALYQYAGLLQMQPYFHPNVAGWKAYYQTPSFYQIWLNSVTLPLRKQLTDNVALVNVNNSSIRLNIDPIPFIESLSNPLDINDIIDDLNLILLPKPISETQIAVLKEIVLTGLPDYEWPLEYQNYKDHPDNLTIKKAIETKIVNLLIYMMRMPEYQLC